MAHFELYQDIRREYRWRLWSNNSKIIAESGESYHNRSDAEAMIDYINSNKFPKM